MCELCRIRGYVTSIYQLERFVNIENPLSAAATIGDPTICRREIEILLLSIT